MSSTDFTFPSGGLDMDAINKLLEDTNKLLGRSGPTPKGGWDSWESIPWHKNARAVPNKPKPRSDTSFRVEDYERQAEYIAAVMRDKCLICNDLDPRGHPETRIIESSGSVKSTLEIHYLGAMSRLFAQPHCGYCNLISTVLESYLPTFSSRLNNRFLIPPKLETITLAENEPVLLTVSAFPDGKHTLYGFELYRDAAQPIPSLPTLGSAGPISDRSDSESCFGFIQGCVSDCDSHSACGPTSSSLPKRVLDLGVASISVPSPHIKLVEPHNQISRYAALSYCWGSGKFLRTLKRSADEKGNIDDMKRGIDFTSLPKIFQDAIQVCRRLEIRYIWIDSLCIIQNDPQDWAAEAAKMGDIYQNAFVTIAAVSSPSSDVPFLRKRPDIFYGKSFRFWGPQKKASIYKLMRSLGPTSKIPVIQARRTARVANDMKLNHASSAMIAAANSMVSGPLSSRGWCLQERALSSRVIHFTDEGIIWECRTTSGSEDSRVCAPGYLRNWKEFEAGRSDPDYRWRLQCFWRTVLMDYTSRNLTRRSDILPALAGISSRMHNLHKAIYLAGLWKDRFIEDLCWQPGGNSHSECEPIFKDDQAMPSWSWITMNNPVEYAVMDEPGTFVSYASVARYPRPGSSPFVQPTRGPLVLKAPVVDGVLTYLGNSSKGCRSTNITFGNNAREIFKPDAPLVKGVCLTESGTEVQTVRRATKNDESRYVKCDVWCIYIGEWLVDSGPFSGIQRTQVDMDLNFVMVVARSTREIGAFERIGMFASVYHGTPDVWRSAKVTDVVIV